MPLVEVALVGLIVLVCAAAVFALVVAWRVLQELRARGEPARHPRPRRRARR